MDNGNFSYLVVFKIEELNYEGPISLKPAGNGTMHLFDEEMYTTLDALEFLLHMPRNIFDLYDIDEKLMNASHDTSHNIVIVPDKLIEKLPNINATMIVLTDDCLEDIKMGCVRFTPALGVYYSKELNNVLLKTLWNNLQKQYKLKGYSTVRDIDTQLILRDEYIKALPTLFLSRQFGEINNFLAKIYNSDNLEDVIIQSHWNYLARLSTLVSLGKQGVTTSEELAKLHKEQYKKEVKSQRVNVVFTLPGVPKRQKTLGTSSGELTDKERRIIRIIGVHRAIARNGILSELPIVSERLFQGYDRLEECCKKGTNNKFVWRTLNNLGKEFESCLNARQKWLLNCAKDITVFSDFPLGIGVMSDSEVPLQCYRSISYQPLTPLTRRLQQETLKKQQLYLGESCKIAIAECISNDERNKDIYKMGEILLQSLKNMQGYSKSLEISRKNICDIPTMINFIKDNSDADILYISAHGHYDRSKNMAGIIVGNEFWMADNIINTPPIVILSACHTAPRGFGCITVADMFLRCGALVVLGAFIPVNARNNMILMTRLFTYIAEAQNKNKQYKTLSDAWSGIVASNAIHELMGRSERFKTWMHSVGKNGKVRIVDFQLYRCVDRLRLTHIYSDTIAIIKEMLAEEEMQGRFDNILTQNDYFPESVFYQMIGSPENIFLHNEIFNEYIQKNK